MSASCHRGATLGRSESHRPGTAEPGTGAARPIPATVVTEAGEITVQASDVLIDSDPSDGPLTQLIFQLVIVDRTQGQGRAAATL